MKIREQKATSEFRRCVRRVARRGWDLSRLVAVIDKLAADAPPSSLFRDHPLSGQFVGKRECHVTSVTDDWVLVYQKVGATDLYLYATGTHSDVFG